MSAESRPFGLFRLPAFVQRRPKGKDQYKKNPQRINKRRRATEYSKSPTSAPPFSKQGLMGVHCNVKRAAQWFTARVGISMLEFFPSPYGARGHE